MSLLNVSALQNIGSGSPNVILNVDGSVTLPVYSNASTPPTPAQAGTLWFNGTSLQIRNLANSAWVSGGGSGVAAITGTLPIAITGTATNPIIAVNAATTALPGSVQLADGAASAAGTSATLVNTPAFSVPKDAAGMTGAALLPSGTNAQRPGTPSVGMLRVNTDYPSDTVEAYDGVTASWRPLQYGTNLGVLPNLVVSANGPLPSSGTYENITINAGVTATVSGVSRLYARTSITINGTITGNFGGLPGSSNYLAGQVTNLQAASFPGQGPGGNGSAYSFITYLGSGGASGIAQIQNDGAAIANGGPSGGALILISDGPIVFSSTAAVSMDGGNGIATASAGGAGTFASAGGAGGGSGGLILLQSARSLNLAAGSSLSVNGGNGANGVIANPGAPNASGGGGGGGGYIVLNSPSTVDSSTKNLAGGTAGSNGGGLGNGTGNGGGFGGAGGLGGDVFFARSPQAGSPGQTLLNSYV
jgi:hypothetical protein